MILTVCWSGKWGLSYYVTAHHKQSGERELMLPRCGPSHPIAMSRTTASVASSVCISGGYHRTLFEASRRTIVKLRGWNVEVEVVERRLLWRLTKGVIIGWFKRMPVTVYRGPATITTDDALTVDEE